MKINSDFQFTSKEIKKDRSRVHDEHKQTKRILKRSRSDVEEIESDKAHSKRVKRTDNSFNRNENTSSTQRNDNRRRTSSSDDMSIYGLIDSIAETKDKSQYNYFLKKLTVLLEQYPDVIFEQKHDFTSLNYVLVKLRSKNNSFDKKTILPIVDVLLSAVARHGDKSKIQDLLAKKTLFGIRVLQGVLITGEPEIVEKTLKIIQGSPSLLKQNLDNLTNGGLMPLDSALRTGNSKVVAQILEALKCYPKILQKNLINRTNVGFMPLDSALRTGNSKVVAQLLEALKCYPEILEKNLANRTEDGFMPLNQAYVSCNKEVVSQLHEVLKSYPELLKKNLANRTEDGFMALNSILKGAPDTLEIEEILQTSLTLLKDYPTILQKNLMNCTNGGFMSFQEAILLGNEKIIVMVYEALEPYPDILKANLANRTNDGFTLVDSLLKAGSIELIGLLLKILKPYPEVFAENLTNRRERGYMPLGDILKARKVEPVKIFLDAIREYPAILEKNFLNCTKSGFMPLHLALCLGNEETITLLLKTLNAYPDILKANLANRTMDGFLPLDNAIKNCSNKVLARLIEVLKCYPEVLKLNLSNYTHRGFTPLNGVLKKGTLESIQLIISCIQQYLPLDLQQEHFCSTQSLTHAVKRNESAVMIAYLETFFTVFANKQHAVAELDNLIKYIPFPSTYQGMYKLIIQAQQGNFPTKKIEIEQEDTLKDKPAKENHQKNVGPSLDNKKHSPEESKVISSLSKRNKDKEDPSSLKEATLSTRHSNDRQHRRVVDDNDNIFALIQKISDVKDESQLHYFVEKIKQLLDKYPEVIFEKKQGYNCFGMVFLHLANNQKQLLVESIALNLTNVLFDTLTKYPNDKVEALLMYQCGGGFRLLQSTFSIKVPLVTANTLKVLQRYPNALLKNLANCTTQGLMPLNSIFKCNEEMVWQLLEVLKSYPEILRKNLANRTMAGLMPLDVALKEGNKKGLLILLEVLKDYPEILEENLANRTEDGFVSLNHALVSDNEEMVFLLLEELKHYPKILRKNLANRSEEGFTTLDSAIKTGKMKVVLQFFEVFKDYPEIFKQNLGNRTKHGYMVLNHLLNLNDKEMLLQFLEVFKRYPTILKENLANRTNVGFMPINQALTSENEEVILLLLDILKEYPELLKKNLTNRTEDGFMPLDCAMKKDKMKMILQLLQLLKEYPDILKENLANRTEKGYMLLNHTSSFEEVILQLLEVLKDYPEILEKNLANCTKDNVMALDSAVRTGKVKIVLQLLEVLKNYPEILKKNLTNYTSHGFTLLQSAFKAGSLKCIQLILFYNQHYLPLDIQQKHLRSIHLLKNAIIGNDVLILMTFLDALAKAFGDKQQAIKELKNLLEILTLSPSLIMEDLIIKALEGNFPDLQSALDQEKNPETRLVRKTSQESYIHSLPKLQREEAKKIAIAKPKGKEHFQSYAATGKGTFFKVSSVLVDIDQKNHDNDAVVQPFAGINPKYLENNPQSALVQNNAQALFSKNQRCDFTPLTEYFNPNPAQYDAYPLRNKVILATFYSQRGDIQLQEQVTFVCAGRKENALVPPLSQGRVVIVCTQEEYKRFYKTLDKVDVLVLHAIHHPVLGRYEELGRIACRRLGIFLAAYHWKIDSFAMLDDNISRVEFNARGTSESWDGFYQLLTQELGREPCVSVTRHYSHAPQPGQLGSKLFMFDMKKLRLKLPTIEDFCVLLPLPESIKLWGEDYYLQIMLYLQFLFVVQGFRVIDKEVATLSRSNQHRNAFRGANPILAQPFVLPLGRLNGLTDWQKDCVQNTISILNKLIAENQQAYKAKKIAQAKLIPDYGVTTPLIKIGFVDALHQRVQQTNLNATLRPYQVEAVRSVVQAPSRRPMQMVMATGTGKTYVQCELAALTFSLLKENEHIVIVTANISLVEQFYQDLMKYRGGGDLSETQVYPISSKHISLEQAALNKCFIGKSKIFIFCIDSLNHLVEKNPHFLSQARLLLLDEFHDYYAAAVTLVRKTKDYPDRLTLGLTATPPEEKFFKTLYTYSRLQAVQQGYLAPLIVDKLGNDYSLANVKALIQLLPDILSMQNHPKFGAVGKLLDTKGIIYLPSIKACNKAKQLLLARGIKSYAIHSENKRRKLELAEFKHSNRGIILACDMCKLGFDDSGLGYVILGQNPKKNASMEQIIGRLMRRKGEKIGYVLAFDDVIDKLITPLLHKQEIPQPRSEAYLKTGYEYTYLKEKPSGENEIFFKISPLLFMKKNPIKEMKRSDEIGAGEGYTRTYARSYKKRHEGRFKEILVKGINFSATKENFIGKLQDKEDSKKPVLQTEKIRFKKKARKMDKVD